MAAVTAGLWRPTAALLALAAAAGLGAAIATLPIPYRPADARPKPPLSGGDEAIAAPASDGHRRQQPRAAGAPERSSSPPSWSLQHQPAATGWLMTAVAAGGLFGSLLGPGVPFSPRSAERRDDQPDRIRSSARGGRRRVVAPCRGPLTARGLHRPAYRCAGSPRVMSTRPTRCGLRCSLSAPDSKTTSAAAVLLGVARSPTCPSLSSCWSPLARRSCRCPGRRASGHHSDDAGPRRAALS